MIAACCHCYKLLRNRERQLIRRVLQQLLFCQQQVLTGHTSAPAESDYLGAKLDVRMDVVHAAAELQSSGLDSV